MTELHIPERSLVALVGVSGSGKSTFARKHFKDTEVLSSDRCRAMISDDENNQQVTPDAFDLLFYIAAKRLKNGLLTVVDATNIQPESRAGLLRLAKEYHSIPVAIVLDLPEKVCEARNAARPDRKFGKHIIYQQRSQLRRSLRKLKDEGFRHIYTLRSEEEIDAVQTIVREKLYSNKQEVSGPFDIIGDIHGCFTELTELLEKLGYTIARTAGDHEGYGFHVVPPQGRKAVFLGDLVDRGPDSPSVLRLVMSMVKQGTAWCVPGNHDIKLQRYLLGKEVQLKHGLQKTVEQLQGEDPRFLTDVKDFIYELTSHYVFDGGRLVVAHAGLPENMHGRGSGAVRSFCMYGETTGEIDEFGLPVRYNWALEYRGKAMVVYGHTPVPEAQWLNHTIDIDTGCVFGGSLTALRYPEEELVSVKAHEVYQVPARPIDFEAKKEQLSHQQQHDDLPDLEDVMGKRIIATRLRNTVTIPEENATAALEVMSRFALHPRWLMYLPPTMSPPETSQLAGFLEHPAEAFQYYRSQGIEKVVCEEKHMGSRAVVIVGKNAEAIRQRFGVENNATGVCYTRTGRNFFTDAALETAFMTRVQAALTTAGIWDQLNTDWICLDTELMPWSVKAQALIKDQYASVGTAAATALGEVTTVLESASLRGLEGIDDLLARYKSKQENVDLYREAYRRYCWPVSSVDDLVLAPFHIMATEGAVHIDKDHGWHMQTIQALAAADPKLFRATTYHVVDLASEEQVQAATAWWEQLTGQGGEGMVVKPFAFVAHGKKGLVQPAIKCRGSEYLRIIYGPEYTAPENLGRLRNRNVAGKRSLALREFALSVEALERFVRREPLRRVHECVFGILALESDAIDPRL